MLKFDKYLFYVWTNKWFIAAVQSFFFSFWLFCFSFLLFSSVYTYISLSIWSFMAPLSRVIWNFRFYFSIFYRISKKRWLNAFFTPKVQTRRFRCRRLGREANFRKQMCLRCFQKLASHHLDLRKEFQSSRKFLKNWRHQALGAMLETDRSIF